MRDTIVPVSLGTDGCPEKSGPAQHADQATSEARRFPLRHRAEPGHPTYLDARNADPKPFRWTAPADTIIGKHQRGKRLLESLQ
jgi:hypothetical protein